MANYTQTSKLIAFLVLLFTTGCETEKMEGHVSTTHLTDPAKYDLSCLNGEETQGSDVLLDVLGKAKDEVMGMSNEEVTTEEEEAEGESTKESVLKEFPEAPKHPKADLLPGLLNTILRSSPQTSGLDYNIYCIRMEAVNAFTVGGEIFVTTALLDDVESTDELACVIGHEVAHNELGHIKDKIKEVKTAKTWLGDEFGELAANGLGMLTIGFNQKGEAEADLMGIDLALLAGFNPCRGIDFWDRMSKQEAKPDEFENMFRSHPYSEKRKSCYRNHLKEAHNHECK